MGIHFAMEIGIAEVGAVIGCVDTQEARCATQVWAHKPQMLYWLDLGNSRGNSSWANLTIVLIGRGGVGCGAELKALLPARSWDTGIKPPSLPPLIYAPIFDRGLKYMVQFG